MNELENKIYNKVLTYLSCGSVFTILNNHGGDYAISININDLTFTGNGNGYFLTFEYTNYPVSKDLFTKVLKEMHDRVDYSELEDYLNDATN